MLSREERRSRKRIFSKNPVLNASEATYTNMCNIVSKHINQNLTWGQQEGKGVNKENEKERNIYINPKPFVIIHSIFVCVKYSPKTTDFQSQYCSIPISPLMFLSPKLCTYQFTRSQVVLCRHNFFNPLFNLLAAQF